jgi:hypothetical protein
MRLILAQTRQNALFMEHFIYKFVPKLSMAHVDCLAVSFSLFLCSDLSFLVHVDIVA